MIYVSDSETLGLNEFLTEADATDYFEGVDVEDGIYLFWDTEGEPLQAQFISPNKRGLFSVVSGTYRLVPTTLCHQVHLVDAIKGLTHFEYSVTGRSMKEVEDEIYYRQTCMKTR
ncbi:MAG: hypothetical protein OIF51_15935 [Cellvibrionaceae bacterium]|nr:hypothetical protein [Cellvibrionaceae bacterium]